MGRVRARIDVEGRASEVEALWYDHRRWPTFVDGLKHVARVEGEWPAAGARVVWDSPAHGRGRVVERVVAYAPRAGQTVEVEDEAIRGMQSVAFAPHGGGVTVTVELAYEPKDPRLRPAAIDLLLQRRRHRDALRRTLRRFAAELAAERDPGL